MLIERILHCFFEGCYLELQIVMVKATMEHIHFLLKLADAHDFKILRDTVDWVQSNRNVATTRG